MRSPYKRVGANSPADGASSGGMLTAWTAYATISSILLVFAVIGACFAFVTFSNSVTGVLAGFGVTVTRTGSSATASTTVAYVINSYPATSASFNEVYLTVAGNLTYNTPVIFYTFGLLGASNGQGYNPGNGTFTFPAIGRYEVCATVASLKAFNNSRPDYVIFNVVTGPTTGGGNFFPVGLPGSAPWIVLTSGGVATGTDVGGCTIITVCPTCDTTVGSYLKVQMANSYSVAQGSPPGNVDSMSGYVQVSTIA
jgi:hypothetical protein